MKFAYEEEYARMVAKYALVESRVPFWRRLLKFLRLMK